MATTLTIPARNDVVAIGGVSFRVTRVDGARVTLVPNAAVNHDLASSKAAGRDVYTTP